MKRCAQWNRSRGASLLVCGGIFCLMLILNILTPYICDDFTYWRNFDTGAPLRSVFEIIPSMAAHSLYMNGRLISHGLAQLFMLLPPIVFDLVNAAVFAGTLWAVCRLCGHGRPRNAALLAAMFCMVWLWTPAFGQVALWQVGAVNYFWSLTACVAFFAPELIRFQSGRVLLDAPWKRALFWVYAFFFGWYNEIASFVGICMVPCLVVLDVWMNRAKLRLSRLMPVLFAVLGFLTMLSMPAQSANKQAGAMTLAALLLRLDGCTRMLTAYLVPLLVLIAVLFAAGLVAKVPAKTLVLSGLFTLAGICANYMPIAASYYPERCMCTTVLMMVMAVGFLASDLFEGKGFLPCCGACLVLLALTLPSGITGCRDILSCHRQHMQREAAIAAALETGELDVTANVVAPQTPYSGYWGLRDLMEDPNTWPNHSMALYYGLDSLIGE